MKALRCSKGSAQQAEARGAGQGAELVAVLQCAVTRSLAGFQAHVADDTDYVA